MPQNLSNLDLQLVSPPPSFFLLTPPTSSIQPSISSTSQYKALSCPLPPKQSLLEPQLRQGVDADSPWIFSTPTPSLVDLALTYQLRWAIDIAAGRGIYNLTAGGTSDTSVR